MKEGTGVLAFVASRAGTGKTTLLESLVPLLKGKGYRVGAVKHTRHEAEVDREGSDSWRISGAGADVTVLAARGMLSVFTSLEDPPLELCLDAASKGTDIVLVEGFKEMPIPKIELFREGHTDALFCMGREGEAHDPHLVAVASDIPLELDVPVLNLNDPLEICGFIVERITGHK